MKPVRLIEKGNDGIVGDFLSLDLLKYDSGTELWRNIRCSKQGDPVEAQKAPVFLCHKRHRWRDTFPSAGYRSYPSHDAAVSWLVGIEDSALAHW